MTKIDPFQILKSGIKMAGTLYFIQPAELVGTNRYKIGCSAGCDMIRCKSYKKGTRYIMVLECLQPFVVEKEVKSQFDARFKRIAGREYYEGDETEMRDIFYSIYLQYLGRSVMESEEPEPIYLPEPNPVNRPMEGIFYTKKDPVPYGIRASVRVSKNLNRPKNIGQCFKPGTLIHHNKCGMNEYALVQSNGSLVACDRNGVQKLGCPVFHSLNAFTQYNYEKRNERDGKRRTTRNNAYTETFYLNHQGQWISCVNLEEGVLAE